MSDRSLDAAGVLYEVGRQLQTTALVMRRHTGSGLPDVCECGRLQVRDLPGLGRRCEVAVDQWDLTREAMCALVVATEHRSRPRAIGRATVSADVRLP